MDASFYGTLLLLLGLILAFINQIEFIIYPSSKVQKGIPKDKRNAFSWFTFFSLTIMGTAVLFINTFADIINYRTVWIPIRDNSHIVYQWTFMNFSNCYTFLIDFIFILIVFFVMLFFVSKVRSGSGKFVFSLDNKKELLFMLFFGYPVGFANLIVFFFLGASLLLLILSMIPTYIFNYVLQKGTAY